jgi:predicted transcriptional regulator
MDEKRDLKIMIGTTKDLNRDIDRFLKNPRLVEKEPGDVIFLTPAQFSEIFSKSRVETLKTIGDTKPKTMTALAKKLKRPKESVSRDVGILSRAGIVEVSAKGLYRSPRLLSRSLNVSF